MERDKRWDTVKGILILLVVAGHYKEGFLHNLIFSFHMPLFFAVSGYMYKESNRFTWQFIKKNAFKYLTPCIAYFLVATIFLTRDFSLRYLLRFLWGGRWVSGVYWFSTCLFLTIISFTWINHKIAHKSIKIIVIFGGGLFAITESNIIENIGFFYHPGIPWNADVVLLALVYFATAFWMKAFITKIITSNKYQYNLLAVCSFLLFCFIYFWGCKIMNIELDMKNVMYKNVSSAFVLPMLAGIILLRIVHYLSYFQCIINFFAYIGIVSIPIMFLHMPFNQLFGRNYSLLIFLMVGVAFPVMINFICAKKKVLQLLFGFR